MGTAIDARGRLLIGDEPDYRIIGLTEDVGRKRIPNKDMVNSFTSRSLCRPGTVDQRQHDLELTLGFRWHRHLTINGEHRRCQVHDDG